MLEVAISTPNNTANATRSVARALPFFLCAEGTAKLLNVTTMLLMMHEITLTIATTMGMGIACVFLALFLDPTFRSKQGNYDNLFVTNKI